MLAPCTLGWRRFSEDRDCFQNHCQKVKKLIEKTMMALFLFYTFLFHFVYARNAYALKVWSRESAIYFYRWQFLRIWVVDFLFRSCLYFVVLGLVGCCRLGEWELASSLTLAFDLVDLKREVKRLKLRSTLARIRFTWWYTAIIWWKLHWYALWF